MPRNLINERLRIYPRLFIGIYLIVAAVGLCRSAEWKVINGKPIGFDFIAFWSASSLVLEGRALGAYEPALMVEQQKKVVPGIRTVAPWIYPPTFLVLVAPLSLLPYLMSYLVFVASTLAIFGAVLKRIAPADIGAMLVLAFPGVVVNALHGQNGFLTASLAGLGLMSMRTRPWVAGVAFGLLTFKPQLAALPFLLLLLAKEWRVLAVAVVTMLLQVMGSLIAFGPSSWQAFVANLPSVSAWIADGILPIGKIPTFFALGCSLQLPFFWCYLLQMVMAILVVALTACIWRKPVPDGLRNAAAMTGTLLLSPYLLDYDLVWLAFPMCWLAGESIRSGWRRSNIGWLGTAWLLPLLPSVSVAVTGLQLAPVILLGFFLSIAVRVRLIEVQPNTAFMKNAGAQLDH